MGADEVNLATLRGSWMICWGRGVARLAGWTAQDPEDWVRGWSNVHAGPYYQPIKQIDSKTSRD